jgi:hypothetical protein
MPGTRLPNGALRIDEPADPRPVGSGPVVAERGREVDLVPPCGDCIHDQLCVIQANMQIGRRRARVVLPDLLPEITLRHESVFVDCSRFLDRDLFEQVTEREQARIRARQAKHQAQT